MSEVISANLLQDVITQDRDPSFEEFDYRPVPILASLTLSVSVISVFAIFSEFGIILALVGIVLSVFGIRQQKKHKGALGGKQLVRLGCFFSVLFFGWGIGNQVHAFVTELPEEHLRVNFYHHISSKKLDNTEDGYYRVPEDIVTNFVGKKIFIKGFMWNTKKLETVKSFILLKDNGNCCWGGRAQPWDMMIVAMKDGKDINMMFDRLVSISGTLRVNEKARAGEPVYYLEATKVEKSKSRF